MQSLKQVKTVLLLFILGMLFSAQMLSLNDNGLIVDKLSYTDGDLVCSFQDMILLDSNDTTIQAATMVDQKFIFFANKPDQTYAKIYDTVKETWSSMVALGPAMQNMVLSILPG